MDFHQTVHIPILGAEIEGAGLGDAEGRKIGVIRLIRGGVVVASRDAQQHGSAESQCHKTFEQRFLFHTIPHFLMSVKQNDAWAALRKLIRRLFTAVRLLQWVLISP